MNKSLLIAIIALLLVPVGSAWAAGSCSPGTADFNAGPIWDNNDAQKKCPDTCTKNNGTWNGQWKTTVPGEMSVCGCNTCCKDVDAGPIFNQGEADQKCPAVCNKAKGAWNGQWKTTAPGEMSVCGCCGNTCPKRTTKDEEAGPIWNQADAEKKCPGVCTEHDGTWNGQWKTTVPGKMSVCGCETCG